MQASRLLFPKGGQDAPEFSVKNISPETPLHTTGSIYFYTNTYRGTQRKINETNLAI
ncbi:hypothetical protein [Calothrix sp. UHCC 0171]|uniref:hypothetical protein n=1 Tax=Calothrix sp. UHCC 0171 TaxID=3110245 RepID=UPI002B20B626|nr:hypothetical protein [Calothrix sp. UHCC 0171]MEA5572697.1 hypothetical protein [Calothrix sp. UHCC 0171]